ncbi:hypothetical protein [Streptomyces tsukubensis]|uniref:TetR family transcriptional regulator n=1 Tax=Streptomyces tsukubensis TaxID=83656 RepID=A0A1V4AH08_9ACTN|nr:hypothetical protein [Streptomyces tsukubensis]OON82901.1 hypothetical protein B1H18_02495 [Streptomyces tsukubensis]QFR91914.1 hypothetical protein GBW32_01185 [Streptomyces tsukubensis]
MSNRRIGQEGGQGNVTAVSFHFGSRTGLMRAIITGHGEQADRIRQRHVAATGDSGDIREWVGCLVRPVTEHLASLGTPSRQADGVRRVDGGPRVPVCGRPVQKR